MKKLFYLTATTIILAAIFLSFKNYNEPKRIDNINSIIVVDTTDAYLSPEYFKSDIILLIDWYQKNEYQLSEIYSTDFSVKDDLYVENNSSAINKYIQIVEGSGFFTKRFVEDIKFKMFYFALLENQGKYKNDINEGFVGDLILHTQILEDVFNAKNDFTYYNFLANDENCIITVDFSSIKRKFYYKFERNKWKIDKIEVAQ